MFDSFAPGDRAAEGPTRLRKVVVSLGTFKNYGFERLARRLPAILPPEADVLWQTGDTDTSALGVSGHHAIPERELTQAIQEPDVLVAHAGVGTALAALEVGKCPVLVSRRLVHGEHVDDHQTHIATELGNRGLTVSAEADDLTLDHLLAASATRVMTLPMDPPFIIRGAQPVASPGTLVAAGAARKAAA